jgi:hypothetical protein
MAFAALAWVLYALAGSAAQVQAEPLHPCAVVQRELLNASLPAPLHASQTGARRRRRPGRSAGRLCVQFLAAKRAAMLHDFVVRAATERVQVLDEHMYRLSPGVLVGPAVVTTDFVGSPIVRVRVTNPNADAVTLLLEVRVADAAGHESAASTVVRLSANDTRTFELLCPDTVIPVRLTWHTMPL